MGLLVEDESVVRSVRPSWSILFRPGAVLLAALGGLVAISVLHLHEYLVLAGAVVVLGALGRFVVRYLRWSATRLVLTDGRLVSRTGVVRRSSVEMPLDTIVGVSVSQSLRQRLWRSGDLRVDSGGVGRRHFRDVPRPNAFRLELYRCQHGARGHGARGHGARGHGAR